MEIIQNDVFEMDLQNENKEVEEEEEEFFMDTKALDSKTLNFYFLDAFEHASKNSGFFNYCLINFLKLNIFIK